MAMTGGSCVYGLLFPTDSSRSSEAEAKCAASRSAAPSEFRRLQGVPVERWGERWEMLGPYGG